jgi:hypothetical protein
MYKVLEKLKEQLKAHTELVEWLFKWVTYLVTALSVLWTAALSLAAKNELHLVVWVEKDIAVYPSELTGGAAPR